MNPLFLKHLALAQGGANIPTKGVRDASDRPEFTRLTLGDGPQHMDTRAQAQPQPPPHTQASSSGPRHGNTRSQRLL